MNESERINYNQMRVNREVALERKEARNRKAANLATTNQPAAIRSKHRQPLISPKGKRKLSQAEKIASVVQKNIEALKNELVGVPDEALVWTPQFKRLIRISEKFGRWMDQVNKDLVKLKDKAGLKIIIAAIVVLPVTGCHTTSAGWPRWGRKPEPTLVTNVIEALHPSGVVLSYTNIAVVAVATNSYRTPRDPLGRLDNR